MKSKYSSAIRFFLILSFICAVSIGTAAARPFGHLVVLRSPNFGWNLGFNLQIDGRPVTTLVQGHSYSTWLPAGPHVLTVTKVPTVGYSEPTSTTVNIQPGAEHLYTAMWDSGLVYLHPGGVSLTPGAHWQNHGDGTP